MTKARRQPERTLVYVDMAYSAQFMKLRNQRTFWEARHSGGYFERVIQVHPLVDLVEPQVARPQAIKLSHGQFALQGMAFRSKWKGVLAGFDFLLSQASFFVGLTRRLRKRRVTVVMTTDALYSGLFGYALARMLRKPLVVAVWGNWEEVYLNHRGLAMPRLLPSKRLQDFVQRFVLRRADHVIVGNENNRRYVLSLGSRPENTSIVTVAKNLHDVHFTDPAARKANFAVLRDLGLPETFKILAYIGRLVVEKHPEEALRAIIRVIQEEPGVAGVLAGEGAMRPELERMVAEAGLQDRIKLPGNIDQVTLGKLLPHCIVLSPLTGMALIEAGLAGAPIVAYDRDWQAEFIDDGRSGYIVAAQDWEAMAERALEIVRDELVAQRFSRAIRDRALSLADKSEIHHQEQRIYERVIRKRQAGKA